LRERGFELKGRLIAERLKRWFADNGDEACPIRSVREACVFSVHSLVKDPPFSKLDLISCRNLLIYVTHELQERILRMFHYGLNPGGYLFLGPSEGIGHQEKLYLALDKKHHIFQRSDGTTAFPAVQMAVAERSPLPSLPAHLPVDDPIERNARRALAKYSPVYVVVDQHHNILRFSGGEAGRYLEPSAGAANLGLFNNLRKTLRPIVRTALQSALAEEEAAIHEVEFKLDGRVHSVTVIVEPIFERSVQGVMFLVAFVERRSELITDEINGSRADDDVDSRATIHDLLTTKAQLQATVDDLETANEEMRSISEEYQSVNEELQSTNEELETSKEEMQSINEELQTVNAEMFAKNETLVILNSDFKNLLDSTQIATVFLDDDLCIKGFTPGMTDIFLLREGDRGRPITEIVTLLDYTELQRDFAKVQRDLSTVERELHVKGSGASFIMRMRPYRTMENVIHGIVMTFVDITARKEADNALRASEERFSAIVKQATVGVAETELKGRFVLTNERYRQIAGRTDEDLRALDLHDIIHPDDVERSKALLGRLVAERAAFQTELRYVRPEGSWVWVHNSVSPLVDRQGVPRHVLTVTLEIGERKRAEEQTSLLLGELDHRVKNILSIISSVILQTLKTSSSPAAFAAAMEGRIAAIARAHSLLTDGGRGTASLRDLVVMELAPYDREAKNISITGPTVALTPRAGLAFAMAIHELAVNAAKYGALSTSGGRLAVTWLLTDESGGMLRVNWIETDGPPITGPPTQSGFGTTLIERTLSHEFDAIVKREFLRSGLHCSIDVPLTAEAVIVSQSAGKEGPP
jgi:two-component system CheB/CheR fusion protein